MENELYKKMYLHLFNAVTDAINEPNHIKRIEILKQAKLIPRKCIFHIVRFYLLKINNNQNRKIKTGIQLRVIESLLYFYTKSNYKNKKSVGKPTL